MVEQLDIFCDLVRLHEMSLRDTVAVALERAPRLLRVIFDSPAHTQDFDKTSCLLSSLRAWQNLHLIYTIGKLLSDLP
jgi:hypothetical protein